MILCSAGRGQIPLVLSPIGEGGGDMGVVMSGEMAAASLAPPPPQHSSFLSQNVSNDIWTFVVESRTFA